MIASFEVAPTVDDELEAKQITIVVTDETNLLMLAEHLKSCRDQAIGGKEIVFDVKGCERYVKGGALLMLESFILDLQRIKNEKKLTGITVKGLRPLLKEKHSLLLRYLVEEPKNEKTVSRKGAYTIR